ncbi:MAG: nucleoside hydrolase [Spirochaetes bacterium]|nr:nucleoside hydrolase [Spirochaetota bacterium]
MREKEYMDRFPRLPDAFMVQRLALPAGQNDMVLDTDTFNEVDDQFALADCLLLPAQLRVEAVYAAPFHNDRSEGPGDGMQRSFDEIHRVLERLRLAGTVPVLKGSDRFLGDSAAPIKSAAALDLVERAMKRADKPLYVLAIGAPTNIASALLLEPRIREKIVLVWLGGQPLSWPTAREFNLQQDPLASQILFNSGVPMVFVPCTHVAEKLMTTLPEFRECLRGKSPISQYLYEIVEGYAKGNPDPTWTKVIWDVATVAWMRDPNLVPSELVHAPILTDQLTYSFDQGRHFMRIATNMSRSGVLGDLYRRLNAVK